MKIVDNTASKEVSMPSNMIHNGTVFRGNLGQSGYTGPFLKVFQTIVQLHSGWLTWTAGKNLVIDNYQPVEAELHIMRDL